MVLPEPDKIFHESRTKNKIHTIQKFRFLQILKDCYNYRFLKWPKTISDTKSENETGYDAVYQMGTT